MTPVEFKGQIEFTKPLREMLENPVFQTALEVARGMSPLNDAVPPDVTPHFAHIAFGAEKGYAKFEANLKWLSKPPGAKAEPAPETDYGTRQELEE